MDKRFAWLAVVVVLVVAAAVYFWRMKPVAPPPPPPVASAPPVAPTAPPEPPSIQHPVPEVTPPAAPLPALADSDAAVKEMIVALFGTDAFARFFHANDLVRRFVVTVDNLPRKTTAQRLMPVKPVPGPFAVSATGQSFEMAPSNALRYRPYVVAMEGVEAKKAVAAYARMYPLFQAAYQELGYPNAYFNDRLVVAIDDLLAAPDVSAPQLAQPKVLYEYADPALEARSAGQKIMLRMGHENAARVKEKLRVVRRELTGQSGPQ